MSRDLIIGILVSLLIHGGLGLSGCIKTKKPVVPREVAPSIELVEMPKVEPDDPPDPADSSDAPPDPSTVAPPSMLDLPGVVQIDSFVQQMQPPPPPSLGKPGAITIPQHQSGIGTGQGLSNIFDLKNLDQVPVAKFQAKPVYPFEMRRQGIAGEVTVGFIVDSNGDVQNAFVVSATQREFEAAALQAVGKWKFRPGKKGGKSVNTRMLQPISFNLSAED